MMATLFLFVARSMSRLLLFILMPFHLLSHIINLFVLYLYKMKGHYIIKLRLQEHIRNTKGDKENSNLIS